MGIMNDKFWKLVRNRSKNRVIALFFPPTPTMTPRFLCGNEYKGFNFFPMYIRRVSKNTSAP